MTCTLKKLVTGVGILNYISILRQSSLFKSAGIYTLSSMVNAAVPFLLMPVLTRYLSPADYGIVAVFQVLVAFVNPLIGLSTDAGIAPICQEKRREILNAYVSSCFIILIISTLALSIGIFLNHEFIQTSTEFPDEWLWSVIVISACQFIIIIRISLWQMHLKSLNYGFFQIGQTLITLVGTLFCVVTMDLGWKGRIIANVVSAVLFAIVAIYLLWQEDYFRLKFDRQVLNRALKIGIPIIPHALGAGILIMVERLFINNMVGVAEAGIYFTAWQISMGLRIIEVSFNTAFVPWLYERLKENKLEINIKIVKYTYIYVMLMIIAAGILSLLGPWILKWLVGEKFQLAGKFIGWLALARAIDSMYFMVCNYIFYTMKNKYIAISTFGSAIVHVIACYILIKFNGAIGAAQANVISSLIWVMLTWYFAAKVFKMPWLFWKVK